MNWPLVILGILACAVIGYVVNRYHTKWQEKKEEEQLIEAAAACLRRWQSNADAFAVSLTDTGFDRKAADKARWDAVERERQQRPHVVAEE